MQPFDWIALQWAKATSAGLQAGPSYARSELGLAALAVARLELGNGEAGANNVGPHVDRYRTGLDGERGPGGAWCAAFVSYCLEIGSRKLGRPCPVVRSHRAKTLFARCVKVGRLVDVPLPGDIACFHRGAENAPTGHIAIVSRGLHQSTGVNVPAATYHTIDGNKGRYPAPVSEWPRLLGEGELGFVRL